MNDNALVETIPKVDENLVKELKKLIGRVERCLNTSPHMTIKQLGFADRLDAIKIKVGEGHYFACVQDISDSAVREVKWPELEKDIFEAFCIEEADHRVAVDVRGEVERERNTHALHLEVTVKKERLQHLKDQNGQAQMTGKWRKEAYPPRVYVPLEEYCVTASVSEQEQARIKAQLSTDLHGYVGQAYNYDDHRLTEEWMLTYRDNRGSNSSKMKKAGGGVDEEDVLRQQVQGLLDLLTSTVQDRVLTELQVLEQPPLLLGRDIVQVPVWGIDCYTRRNLELLLAAGLKEKVQHPTTKKTQTKATTTTTTMKKQTEEEEQARRRQQQRIDFFLEKQLLPAFNAQRTDRAALLSHALTSILHDEVEVKAEAEGSPTSGRWLPLLTAYSDEDRLCAAILLTALERYGDNNHREGLFKVHPKGTGVICIAPNGILPHVLVAEYLGELYPAYRWCERLDVIQQAQRRYQLKPALPDFYNILLERPRQDKEGYSLLYVDASQRANVGSSCSHACLPNVSSAVVAKRQQTAVGGAQGQQGQQHRLTIAMTTTRAIVYGEELSMDYYSVTSSEAEARQAVCLCGMAACRGHFLSLATLDDLQQVLQQHCGPVYRFASLLRACANRPLRPADRQILGRHGLSSLALGEAAPAWLLKYTADILVFVEHERKALPCALLRRRAVREINDASPSGSGPGALDGLTLKDADLDSRCVLEQRVQSLLCCLSMVNQVLLHQPSQTDGGNGPINGPLDPDPARDTVAQLLSVRLLAIPKLLERFMLLGVGTAATATKAAFLQEVRAVLLPLSTSTSSTPSLATVRQTMRSLHSLLITPSYLSLANDKARLLQLADLLSLYGHTVHFARARSFLPIQAQPIVVPARELGTMIPRSKLSQGSSSSLTGGDGRGGGEGSHSNSKQRRKRKAMAAAANAAREEEVKEVQQEVMDEVEVEEEDGSSSSHNSDSSDQVNTTVESVDLGSSSSPVPIAAAIPSSTAPSSTPSFYLDPNEAVFTGSKLYPADFILQQLLAWFTAGSDDEEDHNGASSSTSSSSSSSELFGAVQLPSFAACFDSSELPYDVSSGARRALLALLRDELTMGRVWPSCLVRSFHHPKGVEKEALTKGDQGYLAPLFGSPMLDVTLGQIDACSRAAQEMLAACPLPPEEKKKKAKGGAGGAGGGAKGQGKGSRKKAHKEEEPPLQLDALLAPEQPTNWIQCDACRKWRRVPFSIDLDSLPQPIGGSIGGELTWTCAMNTWQQPDSDDSSLLDACSIPQDRFDPELESTAMAGEEGEGGEGAGQEGGDGQQQQQQQQLLQVVPLASLRIGAWHDVYCTKNEVYYEAQVKRLELGDEEEEEGERERGTGKKQQKGKKRVPRGVFVHYKGWSAKYDEWISPADCKRRIRLHNLYTNPEARDPRQQEVWQGRAPIQATIRSAFHSEKKTEGGGAAGGAAAGGRKRKGGEEEQQQQMEHGEELEGMAGRLSSASSPSKRRVVSP